MIYSDDEIVITYGGKVNAFKPDFLRPFFIKSPQKCARFMDREWVSGGQTGYGAANNTDNA
jgi:hypothetical protein